jgi:hypothetical protein
LSVIGPSFVNVLFSEAGLLAVHLLVTAALAGLIWTIQLVHYPLFDLVDRSRFTEFEASHSSRISFIVGPLMGVELLCALAIVWKLPMEVSRGLAWGSLGLLIVVHATTVLCSVPAHSILGQGFDEAAHQRLVVTNWIRTLGWTTRALLAVSMVLASS